MMCILIRDLIHKLNYKQDSYKPSNNLHTLRVGNLCKY